ncbi:MAG TPA: serine/threonine protein kinase, partial [Verrucomicrobiae bacterium]|nr:serine/threonine protein kinase [Verrucomicrobiae bacterium]
MTAIATLALALLWPEFRGPTGQGLSTATNLPTVWSPTTNVVWKQAVPGLGWSSPVISEERVFLTTAVEKGDLISLQALALQAGSGNILWGTEVFAARPER